MTKIIVLQNEECEHLGVFSKILNQNNISYQYIKLFEQENIPNLKEYAAIIILGGPMNVYEEEKYPFLKKEVSTIKEAMKIKKPILGLCLGAQIIARAAGARVYSGKQKEIGWFTINLTKNGIENKIFKNLEKQITVFQWHQDTFDIPDNGKKLAASNLFPNQAFSIGDNVYAFQFHLEVTKNMIITWIKRYDEELTSLKNEVYPTEIIKSSEQNILQLNNQASLFFSNFLNILK